MQLRSPKHLPKAARSEAKHPLQPQRKTQSSRLFVRRFLRGRQSILIETTIHANLISNGYARSRAPFLSLCGVFLIEGWHDVAAHALHFFFFLALFIFLWKSIKDSWKSIRVPSSCRVKEAAHYWVYYQAKSICSPPQNSRNLADGECSNRQPMSSDA